MLYLKCQGQVVSIDVDERLADKYINANTVHWEFCERWADMVITAQFTQVQKNEETGKDEKRTFNVLVDEVTNTTTMPNEIVAGDVDISAFGEHPVTGVRITTVPIKKRVDKSGFVGDGEIPVPPTPDLYSQLIGRINENSIPYIGENGNWWVGEHDSGVAASDIIKEPINEIRHDIDALADTMALLHAGVPDTSAKAASHELYATDAPMNVTLFGQTTQAGSGDPSPDNVRPISGVDKAWVRAGGKNLFNVGDSADDYINGSANVKGIDKNARRVTLMLRPSGETYAFRNLLYPVKKGDKLTVSFTVEKGNAAEVPAERVMVRVLDKNRNVITNGVSGSYNAYYQAFYATANAHTFEITNAEAAFAMFGIGVTPASSADNYTNAIASNIMAAYGENVPYEPYNANVITPPLLPDGEPLHGDGTVMDTVENDVLVEGERKCRVTRKWKTVMPTSKAAWVKPTTRDDMFYTGGIVNGNDVPVFCDRFNAYPTFVAWSAARDRGEYAVCVASSVLYVSVPVSKTLDEFKTWWDSLNPVVSYQLTTPEVYMTDPIELRKPVGLMPVTVTGSGETEVAYSCDTKSYIDRKFDALAAALIGG